MATWLPLARPSSQLHCSDRVEPFGSFETFIPMQWGCPCNAPFLLLSLVNFVHRDYLGVSESQLENELLTEKGGVWSWSMWGRMGSSVWTSVQKLKDRDLSQHKGTLWFSSWPVSIQIGTRRVWALFLLPSLVFLSFKWAIFILECSLQECRWSGVIHVAVYYSLVGSCNWFCLSYALI